jgi:hypothetical protein
MMLRGSSVTDLLLLIDRVHTPNASSDGMRAAEPPQQAGDRFIWVVAFLRSLTPPSPIRILSWIIGAASTAWLELA